MCWYNIPIKTTKMHGETHIKIVKASTSLNTDYLAAVRLLFVPTSQC